MLAAEHANKSVPTCSTCIRLKHFYPFLGYLLPTILITYGIAVPRSCLTGVNAQTLGFGVAMIGAGLAYWVGIRLALRGGTALQLRHWMPAIAFNVLAIVVGYGFIIPGSCISGVNENSVGFGVALLFATVAYRQGIRQALPGSAAEASSPCAKPMTLKHFYPLFGFVVPTLIIGYGIVIPRSGIAATSEPSIGFGMALLGACAAYWQGVRLALRERRLGRKDNDAAA